MNKSSLMLFMGWFLLCHLQGEEKMSKKRKMIQVYAYIAMILLLFQTHISDPHASRRSGDIERLHASRLLHAMNSKLGNSPT